MLVQNRKGNWVARVYTQDPGNDFKVVAEQYYSTRAEMRDGIQLWKKLTASSATKVKIKTYRILGDMDSLNHPNYDRVWYKQTR